MEEEEREGKAREKGERVGRITMHKQTHAPRQRRDPNPKTRTKSKQKGKGKKKKKCNTSKSAIIYLPPSTPSSSLLSSSLN